MNNKRFFWFVVILWMAVIFYLSHQPATESASLSFGIMNVMTNIIQTLAPYVELDSGSFHYFIRKAAHFFAYFVLGVLVFHALLKSGGRHWRSIAFALIISVLYAISDEVHQLFVPGRSGQVQDVLIDSAGACVGIAVYSAVIWLIKKWPS